MVSEQDLGRFDIAANGGLQKRGLFVRIARVDIGAMFEQQAHDLPPLFRSRTTLKRVEKWRAVIFAAHVRVRFGIQKGAEDLRFLLKRGAERCYVCCCLLGTRDHRRLLSSITSLEAMTGRGR